MTDEEQPVDPDDESQQSVERDRVEQERKLSSPEEAEGGERGEDSGDGDAEANPHQSEGKPKTSRKDQG